MSTLIALHPTGHAVRRGADPRPAEAPALRLTARGRRLVAVLATVVVALAVVVGALLLSGTAQAGDAVHQTPVSYHVVLPGETLWQIAGEVAPGADRRETVHTLMELNALSTAAVQVGQRVAVPAEKA